MAPRKQPKPTSDMKRRAANPDLLNDYHLLAFDTIDSTNEEAKRIAGQGGQQGAVVWAKKQTAGKGRMGRTWVSPEGNLYVSILLHPPCKLQDVGQLSFVAAAAAFDALKPLLPEDRVLELKWPNDILIDGRKVGGILLESFGAGTPQQLHVVIGLGLNIDNYPHDVMYPATCVKECGVEIVSAKIVLSRFIHHFIDCYNLWTKRGFSAIRRKWLEHAFGLGQPIRVSLPNEEIHGVFEGLSTTGELKLSVAGSRARTINAGDIFGA